MAEPESLVVRLRGVSVDYKRGREIVPALCRVDLGIPAGGIAGLTGPSGSGKSTLARCIAGWQHPSAGSVERFCKVQLVMQDPGASLNPRFTAFEIVEEPLRIASWSGDRAGRVGSLLDLTGLGADRRDKRAVQFSGGERARLAIARALAAMPDSEQALLILDESLSGLDSATPDSILRLLSDLPQKIPLTCLLVSHDRDLLARVATRTFEIDHGQIV